VCLCRHNQELEQDSVIMQEEQRKLQREANSLAQRLEAVLHDKFTPRSGFDADTPIDKTLQFLQGVIAVNLAAQAIASACMHTHNRHISAEFVTKSLGCCCMYTTHMTQQSMLSKHAAVCTQIS
jgi:hypothetical protein